MCVCFYQLQCGEVAFPPQIFLHVRTQSCQAVVRIHDDVYEGVEQADEERYTHTHTSFNADDRILSTTAVLSEDTHQ